MHRVRVYKYTAVNQENASGKEREGGKDNSVTTREGKSSNSTIGSAMVSRGTRPSLLAPAMLAFMGSGIKAASMSAAALIAAPAFGALLSMPFDAGATRRGPVYEVVRCDEEQGGLVDNTENVTTRRMLEMPTALEDFLKVTTASIEEIKGQQTAGLVYIYIYWIHLHIYTCLRIKCLHINRTH